MSLLMWLPLTKDLQNQGCSIITEIINNNIDFSFPGKVGEKCLIGQNQNNTVELILNNLENILSNGNSYSLTCWFKLQGNANEDWIIKLGLNNCGLKWSKITNQLIWYENNAGEEITGEQIANDYFNWHHLIILINKTISSKTIIKVFVDGSLIKKKNITVGNIQPIGNKITIYPYIACLNDIRFYNHMLSNAEAKEISQGLILHWKLNNLNIIEPDSSGFHNKGIVYGNITSSSDLDNFYKRYNKSVHFNNSSYITTKPNSFEWWDYKKGTIAYWAKPTENLSSNLFINNKWQHYACVFNNSTLKQYINGELKFTSSIDLNNDYNFSEMYFTIGLNFFEYDENDEKYYIKNFIGDLNDVRFYITPLLDFDIKMLYNISMRVDNFGQLHAFEYIEDEKEQNTRGGVLRTHKLEENNALQAKFKKEGWLSSNFIEI